MPPELAIFGEDVMLERFREAPPDWIVLVSRPLPEYGLKGFGLDYAVELADWIERNYQHRQSYGAPPQRWNSEFGLQLLRHTGDSAETTPIVAGGFS